MDDTFKFIKYQFNLETYQASFHYQGADNTNFTEKVTFVKNNAFIPENQELLDRALFLAWILIGTSYYKSHPTHSVTLNIPIDTWQAKFFSTVYQEGLSQFAFENNLRREDLAKFSESSKIITSPLEYSGQGNLVLQSGGKDSLLVGKLLQEKQVEFTPFYVTSRTDTHPAVIDTWKEKPEIILRKIDLKKLKKSNGLNGHVPVTYIVESLALIQAILDNKNTIVVSIAQEGNESHAKIGDLEVNHQWSKSWQAEQLLAKYVAHYLSPNLHIGSPLRKYSELKVAELFVKHCWTVFGHSFSSCNRANYRQGASNMSLTWCADCAKCANSYLLFCPFLPAPELQSIFGGEELFQKPSLIDIFKGLLDIDGFIKPFECIGTIDELRKAYELRNNGYQPLPFSVSTSDFDYQKEYPLQKYFQNLL